MLTVEKIIGDLHLTEMKIDSKSDEYLIIFLCGETKKKNNIEDITGREGGLHIILDYFCVGPFW